MNKKISQFCLVLLTVIALSACDLFPVETEKEVRAPVAAPALETITSKTKTSEQSGVMTPLPASYVDAQFPTSYKHSYTFKYPSTMKFEVGMDTDVSSGALVTQDDQQFVRIIDLALMGCKGDPADCSIDTAVPFTADEMYESQISQFSKDESFKPLLVFPMPSNNLVQISAFEGTEDSKKVQLYLVNVGTGVLSVTFFEPDKLPTGFIGDILASFKPSK